MRVDRAFAATAPMAAFKADKEAFRWGQIYVCLGDLEIVTYRQPAVSNPRRRTIPVKPLR